MEEWKEWMVNNQKFCLIKWKKIKLVFSIHGIFLAEMTSKQVSDDNEAMSNTMYKLLKKYQAVRQIVKTLHVSIFNCKNTNVNSQYYEDWGSINTIHTYK